MSQFVSFFSYTDTTWQKLGSTPGDRPAAVEAVARKLGGSVVSLHYMLGPYDGMVITDLPDTCAAAAMSTVAMCSGAFRQMHTHALLTPDQLPQILELSRLGGDSFQAPGSA